MDIVGTGIVTYNPDLSDLALTLPQATRQTDFVIVVDNGSSNISGIEELASKFSGISLIQNTSNLGVAHALNQIFTEAQKRKATWVLTLDDDSILPKDLISQYFSCIEKQNIPVGIVCPLLRSKVTNQISHSKTSNTECITSGSLTRVSAWEDSGRFDDWLFIDSVDFDFSRRVSNLGMAIVECTQVIMSHEIGLTKIINLRFAHPAIRNHSPIRKYYQERNYPYVDYKYSEYHYFKELLRFIKHTFYVLLWEKNKKEKIVAMFNGRRDALIKIKEMRRLK